jgi:hypothetical protein
VDDLGTSLKKVVAGWKTSSKQALVSKFRQVAAGRTRCCTFFPMYFVVYDCIGCILSGHNAQIWMLVNTLWLKSFGKESENILLTTALICFFLSSFWYTLVPNPLWSWEWMLPSWYSHCFVDPVQSVARHWWINFTYVPETAGVLLQSLLRWAGTYTWQRTCWCRNI